MTSNLSYVRITTNPDLLKSPKVALSFRMHESSVA